MVEYGGAPQGVEVAIGVQTHFAGAVVPVGELLARVAERLEMADGVGVFEHGEWTTALGHSDEGTAPMGVLAPGRSR